MPKQNFFVTEEELDNFQIQLLQKRIDRSMIVSGCAGSGKSILALWKAKHIQALPEKASYKFIVYTKALHKFMSDGIKAIGLDDDNFTYHHQWKSSGCPSADYIIVDEIQDFTREEVSAFKSAAKKAFFFWGDSAQALYRNIKPTQNILTISAEASIQAEPLIFNYRLPAKIARLAMKFGDDEELVRRCKNEGSEKPRILRYNRLEEQLDVSMQQINNRQISDAAILFPTNALVQRAYEYLKMKGYNVEAKFDDKQNFSNSQLDLNFESDNPKLMTYHSAKGLQFEAVFMPECDLPEKMGIEPLYVAITRSYRYLFIMYSNQLSRFFDAVPQDLYSTTLKEARIEL
jgi:superfamily I DNA/RNA helicase